ncbi:hypothetical protein KC711_00755 [Candidatus Peregrinibacteria bacterium]|nr:hypothetical protein [Candidatus Peregrinibacteria bacterium]MCB9804741.1 hypothetical protein [Candidatus Peribacteria bacterium]
MNSSLNTESNNSPLSRLLRKEKTIVSRTENKMEIIRFLDDLEGFLGALENKGLTYSKSTDGTYVLRYMNDHRQMIPESLLRERYSEEQKTFKIYLEEYYDLAKKHSLNISEHHGLNFLAYTPIEILAENTEYLKTIDVDAQLISNLLNDELAVSLEQRIAFYRKKFYLKDVFGFDNWEKCMKQFLEKNKSITFQAEEYFELWGLLAEDGIIKNLNEFLLEKFMVLNFTDKEEFLDYFRNHKKSVPKNIKEYIFKEKDVKLIGSHINMFEPIDPVFFESIKETIFT